MALTTQQQFAIDTVANPDNHLVLLKACAGSGKTHTLIELAKHLHPKSGLYLAYNKAIADEATTKFKGTKIKCSTIHSLAYGYTVRPYGLKVGFFNVRDVKPASTPYGIRMLIVNTIEDFCLSSFLCPEEFMTHNDIHPNVQSSVMGHLNAMTNGTIACTHSFYLKLFHVYLASGDITVPEVDLLLIDEAGDLTELTVEVFRLLKAKKKVAVGDPMQNIYGFNKTINAFNVLKDEGVTTTLTESFRVSDDIAFTIQQFVHKYIDKTYDFTGRVYPSNAPIETSMYITRTNTYLLHEMFRLKENGIGFNTTRPIDTIIELPLILATLDKHTTIKEYKYKHIEKLRVDWGKSAPLRQQYPELEAYVRNNLKGDEEADIAFKVVDKHRAEELIDLAKYVRECSKSEWPLLLSTAHSVKGLESDSVTIAPDLNEKVAEAIEKMKKNNVNVREGTKAVVAKLNEEYLSELRLYYVATTRAKVELINATKLPTERLMH